MPRPRREPLFELGGQWIATDPDSAYLYRFWNDTGARRTRRASLGTANLEDAKQRLAEIVVKGEARTPSAALAIVLENYFEARTDKLPSKKPARSAGALMLQCWGEGMRVHTAVSEAEQKRFAEWSLARGHSLAYVSRNLSVLAAALAHAGITGDVFYNEGRMMQAWALQAKAPRRVFVPSDADFAKLLNANMPDNLFRWLVMASLTGGRPEALIDLSPASRLKDAKLIDLNPEGRRQNKKFRPLLREPKALTGWLDKWEQDGLDAFGGFYCSYTSRNGLKMALARVRRDIDLPKLSLYSVRHKVTTVLRASRVASDEVAFQLGHRRPDNRMTDRYGEYNPDYLKRTAAALDAWWFRLQRLTEKPLFSRGIPDTIRTQSKTAA